MAVKSFRRAAQPTSHHAAAHSGLCHHTAVRFSHAVATLNKSQGTVDPARRVPEAFVLVREKMRGGYRDESWLGRPLKACCVSTMAPKRFVARPRTSRRFRIFPHAEHAQSDFPKSSDHAVVCANGAKLRQVVPMVFESDGLERPLHQGLSGESFLFDWPGWRLDKDHQISL